MAEGRNKQHKTLLKDLQKNITLTGVKFRDPKTKTVGYWYSQWGYEEGEAGVWYKKDMKSGQVFPLFLKNLKEALDFEVLNAEAYND